VGDRNCTWIFGQNLDEIFLDFASISSQVKTNGVIRVYKSVLSKNVLYKRFMDLLVNTFINQLLINVLPQMSSAQQVSRIWKGGAVVIVMKSIKIIPNIKFCSTFPFIILKSNEKI
jgi:hypothetical protein